MEVTFAKLVELVEQRLGGDAVINTDKEALLVTETIKETLGVLDLHIDKRTGEVYSAVPAPATPRQGPAHSKYIRPRGRR